MNALPSIGAIACEIVTGGSLVTMRVFSAASLANNTGAESLHRVNLWGLSFPLLLLSFILRFLVAPCVLGTLLIPMAVSGQTPSLANYALQIILPRAARSSPDTGGLPISPNHRIFWAYPGVQYNIRGAVIGGVYPYRFSLENAPAGMTMDPATGEIDWPDPRANATNILFKVMDAAGSQVSTLWSIAVASGRFIFVNASASEGGNGSFDRPYRQLSKIPEAIHYGKILYFMSGTYQVLDMLRAGSDSWERVEINGGGKPVAWLEYPGESAVIDFGWKGSGSAPLIRMGNGSIYLDGLETANSHNIAFQFESPSFGVVRRMTMHHQGPGQDGANSAFIMFLASYGSPALGMVIQDNTFSDIINGTGNCALKLYSLNKCLIEDNIFHGTEAGTEAIVAIKSDNPRFTVRRNTFYDIGTPAIGGNMHRVSHATFGEILYNNVRGGATEAIFINQDGQAARIDVYRNTFKGRVRMRFTDADDGPFHFYNNVIISNDPLGRWVTGSRIHFENVTDRSRVLMTNNLEGPFSSAIIDAFGFLTPSYASQLGTHGWQLLSDGVNSPRLKASGIQGDGTFRLRLTDAPAVNYVIRASTDLIRWESVATNQAGMGGLSWKDPETARHRQRFYRVDSSEGNR